MTNQPSKPKTVLTTLSLLALSVAAAVVAFAPAASAHVCVSDDPATACGSCDSGYHRHDYAGGGTYCHSDGEDPPADDCTILGRPAPKIVCDGPQQIGIEKPGAGAFGTDPLAVA